MGTTLAFLTCLPKKGLGVTGALPKQVSKYVRLTIPKMPTESAFTFGEPDAGLAFELLAFGEFVP